MIDRQSVVPKKPVFEQLTGRLRRFKRRVSAGAAKSLAYARIRTTAGPLLSIVVPMFNVEDHLDECLTSIRTQTYSNLEIIVVDDGSIDNSASIARRHRFFDRRIKFVSQSNAGLGAARNVGIERARGKYIAFADSDDFVPPRAYETMVRTLEKTGSQFVTGAFYRFNSTNVTRPKWSLREHVDVKLKIGIHDYIGGLVNVYAWNKLYNLEFLRSIDFHWTEGRRYEDQEPSTRLMLLSDSFDVIPDEVYAYRMREKGESITQSKHLVEDVQDRLAVMRMTKYTVEDLGDQVVLDAWVAKQLRYDLLPYIREALMSDDDYRVGVQAMCSLLVPMINDSVADQSPVKVRFVAAVIHKASASCWEDAGQALLQFDEFGSYYPLDAHGFLNVSDWRLQSSCSGNAVRRLSLDETSLVAAATRCEIVDSSVFVEGWAILKNRIDQREALADLRVFAVESTTGERLPLDVSLRADRRASDWARSKVQDLDEGGFFARIELEALVNSSSDDALSWTFVVETDEQDQIESTLVDRTVRGAQSNSPDTFLDSHGRFWSVQPNKMGVPTLRMNSRVQPVSLFAEDRKLTVQLPSSGGQRDPRIRVSKGTVRHDVPDSGSSVASEYVVDWGPRGLPFTRSSWRLQLHSAIGRQLEMVLPEGRSQIWLNENLGIRWQGKNDLRIELAPPLVSVTGGHVNRVGDLILDLEPTVVSSFQLVEKLVLVSGDDIVAESTLDLSDNRNRAIFNLRGVENHGPINNGRYAVKTIDGVVGKRSVFVEPWGPLNFPHQELAANHRVVFERTRFNNLWLRLDAPVADDEYGVRNQWRLRCAYRHSESDISYNRVIFHSYLGEQATDSSRAISEFLLRNRPEIEVVWATANHAVDVPAGCTQVVMGTRLYYEEMARCEFVVHNIYFDPWFEIKPNQKFIQTWHGTPLKTINHSYWRGIGRSPAWIARMDRQARSWSSLISPSAYYSEIVPRESGYSGSVLQVGYPRNDALVNDRHSNRIRDRVRRDLGIPHDKTAVLYAPTWRDSQSSRSWKADMVEFFSSDGFARDLGQDNVLLLRGHGHNARARSSSVGSDLYLDVTHHPDFNELVLASDLIVTDYSSLFFDVVEADKPILFFVPDFDEYVSSPRGVYLSLAEIAPGPLLFEYKDLVREILSQDWKNLPSSSIYLNFKERFAPHSDGRSTERVVEALWPER